MLLFWSVGAYNRLVRLRALAIAAFLPLHLQYGQYVALVQKNWGFEVGDERFSARASVLSAAQQFETSLKAASAQPLDSLVMRALETAYEVLLASWARVCGESQNLMGAPLPEELQREWTDISLQTERDRAEFTRRILDYNQGVQQFPANVLAWLFRFKPTTGAEKLNDEH